MADSETREEGMANPEVDAYIGQSERWPEEMIALRPILLGCGLTEDIKWGKPCYGYGGKNIVILQEMKDFLSLMFFKGALLRDPEGVLEEQGPNSRSARRIRLTSVEDVVRLAETIEAYVGEAVGVEEAGLEMGEAPAVVLAEELRRRLDADPEFRAAFEALTPGRQREYNLFVSAARQAATRIARVDRYAPKILDGKGLRD
jgi:uncharacterized protein YdeI (YjbR/CyaY-like superfamily)